jgi:hypothetical protein
MLKEGLHPKAKGKITTSMETHDTSAYGIFSGIALLSNNTSLNKFENIEILSCVFPDHNKIKLEIINNKTSKTIQIHVN